MRKSNTRHTGGMQDGSAIKSHGEWHVSCGQVCRSVNGWWLSCAATYRYG